MHGNLFVVSRVGQLRNVQAFIAEYRATANVLAVLHTPANPALLDGIRHNIDESLFERVVFVEQPTRPTVQRRSTNRIIYDQIRGLLHDAVDHHSVTNLFLCNVDNYYSLFERIAVADGMSLTFNLLEEGLGTYGLAGHRQYESQARIDWVEVRNRASVARAAWGKALRATAVLTATWASWLLRTDLFRLRRNGLNGLLVPSQMRYGTISRFDRAFVYFPQHIGDAGVEVGQVERLRFSMVPSFSAEELSAIPRLSAVFVSQKYLPAEIQFEIVFRILAEMGFETVEVKLHPRESPVGFRRAQDANRMAHAQLAVSCSESIQAVPVEDLMMAGAVSVLVGLTSTSLMYAKEFFPEVRAISIARRFRRIAVEEYGVSSRELAEFDRDLAIFEDVAGVDQF